MLKNIKNSLKKLVILNLNFKKTYFIGAKFAVVFLIFAAMHLNTPATALGSELKFDNISDQTPSPFIDFKINAKDDKPNTPVDQTSLDYSSAYNMEEIDHKKADEPNAPVSKTELEKIDTPNITINKIGLNKTSLDYSSAYNMEEIDKKLLENPIIENQITGEPCTQSQFSYIYGHSESPNPSVVNHAGTSIFSNLDKLSPGDIIIIVNNKNQKCTYKVKQWDQVTTTEDGSVTLDEFYKTYFPEISKQPVLTIQTCKKGSSTVRLLLRAELVS